MEIKLFSRKSKADAFEALAAREEKRVYSLCFHMMGSREDAADCAQETMLRAFRAFDTFRGEASFGTWIAKIAMNVCTDALRKRRNTVSLDELREDTGFDVPDAKADAHLNMEQGERIRLLREGLKQLPEEMRRMIVLRDVEGMPYDAIAEMLGLPLGTVKSRVSRAREKLSQILKKSSELFDRRSV